MSVLPLNTILGKLEIIEIFEYYDKPLLFVCRNASDSLYLVVLEDEELEYESWLYASMSPIRFQQIRSGGIDLYSAFKNAENGFVFVVKQYLYGDKYPEINIVNVNDLQDEQLPVIGESLDLQTVTIEKEKVSIERQASQLQREYVELALEILGQNRNEAPILVLSDVMKDLQQTIIFLGHTVSDLYKESKSPTQDLKNKLELSLVDVSAGSFKLEMASSEASDIFGDSLIGDALEELSKLIKIGSNEEELRQLFETYKRTVPKSYLSLLKTIKNSRINTANLRWASANGQRVGEAIFSAPIVFSTIESIEQMYTTETNIIKISGQLTGAFTDREFEIEARDKTYRGKLDNEVLSIEASDIINNARLGNRYSVTLRERIDYRIATDETRTNYYLIDVIEDNLQ